MATLTQGIFGSVPGNIQMPNPYQEVGQAFPALQGVQTGASNAVMDQLQGQLSPDTLASIQNQGAAWGVASGMPGSGVANNRNLYEAGLTSMNEQNQGKSNYGGLAGNSSQFLTVSPQLQEEIAQQNAVNAASPNPSEVGMMNLTTEIAGLGWGYSMNNLGQSSSDTSSQSGSDTGGSFGNYESDAQHNAAVDQTMEGYNPPEDIDMG